MTVPSSACSAATANLRQIISLNRRFPQNVFIGDWSNFLFFDSDWMFDSQFVASVSDLLEAEGATCACLMNLDFAGRMEERIFFVKHHTTADMYQEVLSGANPGSGWVYDIARFGCVSEKSTWCIYCERASEIAVIAFRQSIGLQPYMTAIAQLHAARLKTAIEDGISYGFSEHVLSAEWRDTLLREYAQRSAFD